MPHRFQFCGWKNLKSSISRLDVLSKWESSKLSRCESSTGEQCYLQNCTNSPRCVLRHGRDISRNPRRTQRSCALHQQSFESMMDRKDKCVLQSCFLFLESEKSGNSLSPIISCAAWGHSRCSQTAITFYWFKLWNSVDRFNCPCWDKHVFSYCGPHWVQKVIAKQAKKNVRWSWSLQDHYDVKC